MTPKHNNLLLQLGCITLAMLLFDITTTNARMVPVVSEYSITPSSQLAYYHYPAPNRVLAGTAKASTPSAQTQYAARYAARLQQHATVTHQPRTQHFQPIYQPQRTLHHQRTIQQQQQQQQQQHHQHQQQPHPQQYAAHAAPLARQFTSLALENAAFTMALSSQGYVFGPVANGASVGTATPAAAALPQPRSSASIIAASTANDSASLNVKLPVPFGITPLNIAPLPLQGGAPYDSLPRGLTSYGTLHPLRR